jgi:hypothetical protein
MACANGHKDIVKVLI